jgi:hypothetical protein
MPAPRPTKSAAFLEVEIANTQRTAITYTVLCALSNPLAANHLNRVQKRGGVHLLHLASDGFAGELNGPDRRFKDANLTLATDAADVSYQEYWFKGAWFDELEVYWRNLTARGRLENRRYAA